MKGFIGFTVLIVLSAMLSLSSATAQLQQGDTLRYTMTFLPQVASGFVTIRDSSVRVPAAKVVFEGQLFRVGFLPSAKNKDTVVVLGGTFPADLTFHLTVDSTGTDAKIATMYNWMTWIMEVAIPAQYETSDTL